MDFPWLIVVNQKTNRDSSKRKTLVADVHLHGKMRAISSCTFEEVKEESFPNGNQKGYLRSFGMIIRDYKDGVSLRQNSFSGHMTWHEYEYFLFKVLFWRFVVRCPELPPLVIKHHISLLITPNLKLMDVFSSFLQKALKFDSSKFPSCQILGGLGEVSLLMRSL